MTYRTLGRTGLTVSAVGFGGWAIGGNAFGESYGSTDDAVSLAALNRAYDLGCTVYDTADAFGRGHSETLIGRALKGWNREEVVLCTKGATDWTGDPPKKSFSEAVLRRNLEESLKRLGVDAIDVYHLHTPPLELIQHAQVFEVLRAFQAEGKIRFFGVAIHDPLEGRQAIERGGVHSIQAVWNLLDRRIETGLIPACQETGTGLMIREPLARGFLSGRMTADTAFEKGDVRAVWPRPLVAKRVQAADMFKPHIPPGYRSLAQLAIAYALHEPAVSTVLVGCKTPEQVEEAMAVPALPPLSPEVVQAIQATHETIFGRL